ncbi:MAG TPA: preprotein translocase subunit SecG [Flavobacteriaceae bacterium]|nr:preprotein translocase subunit SecG [Flavobacteriaceae bacterium]
MSTSVIILALIIVVCFLLVVVIMVQNPKEGGLSSSFGGGGGQQMGGVKKTGDFLDKSTWTLATALLVLILLYNVTGLSGSQTSESRLMDETTPSAVPASDNPTDQSQEPIMDFNSDTAE